MMTTPNLTWTPEQDAVLREMWAANRSGSEIAAAVGKSDDAVYDRRRRLGLPNRDRNGVESFNPIPVDIHARYRDLLEAGLCPAEARKAAGLA